MKIKPKSSKKVLISVIVALLVIFAAGIFILQKTGIIDLFNTGTHSGPTPQQKAEQSKTDAKQKSTYLNNSKTEKDGTNTSQAKPAPVPTDTSSIQLSAKQQGSTVVVTTKLTGQGYSSGSCKLTATQGVSTNSQTADIIYQPEYSTCAGFSVPVSTLGSGTWQINLSVTPLNGETLTKSTSLLVN